MNMNREPYFSRKYLFLFEEQSVGSKNIGRLQKLTQLRPQNNVWKGQPAQHKQ